MTLQKTASGGPMRMQTGTYCTYAAVLDDGLRANSPDCFVAHCASHVEATEPGFGHDRAPQRMAGEVLDGGGHREDAVDSLTSKGTTSVTRRGPVVKVPVLSKATAWTRPIVSMKALPLKRIPWRAPLERADRRVGIIDAASAHGEATTRKIIERYNAA